MWPGRTGKPSGAARSRIKRRASSLHPISGLPEIKPPQKAQAVLEPVAPRPRGGTVDTADLKSASGKPECRFESGRGHQFRSEFQTPGTVRIRLDDLHALARDFQLPVRRPRARKVILQRREAVTR